MQRTLQGQVARALTIAGSDSGGGAGIQADLKTFSAFAVYGTTALAAVTAQNTIGVQAVFDVPPDIVSHQLTSVLDDIGTHAVKTGMLSNSDVIETVAKVLSRYHVSNVVVDPVMVAKGGAMLLQSDAVKALKHTLLPLADIVTPNLPEADSLCGYPIKSWKDCERAAKDLFDCGPRMVVIKGGHADWQGCADDAIDLVYDGRQFTTFQTRRITSQKTHGTGCTFSAAITACLARGMKPLDAIATAKAFVTDGISAAANWDIGAGHGPTDHSVPVRPVSGISAGRHYERKHLEWNIVS